MAGDRWQVRVSEGGAMGRACQGLDSTSGALECLQMCVCLARTGQAWVVGAVDPGRGLMGSHGIRKCPLTVPEFLTVGEGWGLSGVGPGWSWQADEGSWIGPGKLGAHLRQSHPLGLCFCIYEMGLAAQLPKMKLAGLSNVCWFKPHLYLRPREGSDLVSVAQQVSDCLEVRPRASYDCLGQGPLRDPGTLALGLVLQRHPTEHFRPDRWRPWFPGGPAGMPAKHGRTGISPPSSQPGPSA